LRGNLGPEILAALEACSLPLAIVAPAFPAMKRALIGGRLCVNNREPARPVDLPGLLRRQGIKDLVHLDYSILARGREALLEYMTKGLRAGTHVVACDSVTQEDLENIARAAMGFEQQPLLVGSAGLAAAAAPMLGARYHRRQPAKSSPTVPKKGTVIFLLGSTTRVTQQQTSFLVRNRPSEVATGVELCGRAFAQALKEKHHLVMIVEPGEDRGKSLAEILQIISSGDIRGLVLSGGHTANLVCRSSHVIGIKLEGEIAPGIPWGRLVGGLLDGLPVATKAGGFGNEDCLVTIADFLSGQERVSP
jgi:D-threonate/D-erythronate kinase